MSERSERTVRLSVLDRLMDEEPRVSRDRPMTWAESVERFKTSILRDLEWLLNTRRIIREPSDDFPELTRSLYCYGAPDISSMSGDSPSVRRRLLRHVEELIRVFEPRLTGVRVSLVEGDDGTSKQIRFRVEGVLRMEPDPERVSFDTVLEIASGKFLVSGGRNA